MRRKTRNGKVFHVFTFDLCQNPLRAFSLMTLRMKKFHVGFLEQETFFKIPKVTWTMTWFRRMQALKMSKSQRKKKKKLINVGMKKDENSLKWTLLIYEIIRVNIKNVHNCPSLELLQAIQPRNVSHENKISSHCAII